MIEHIKEMLSKSGEFVRIVLELLVPLKKPYSAPTLWAVHTLWSQVKNPWEHLFYCKIFPAFYYLNLPIYRFIIFVFIDHDDDTVWSFSQLFLEPPPVCITELDVSGAVDM